MNNNENNNNIIPNHDYILPDVDEGVVMFEGVPDSSLDLRYYYEGESTYKMFHDCKKLYDMLYFTERRFTVAIVMDDDSSASDYDSDVYNEDPDSYREIFPSYEAFLQWRMRHTPKFEDRHVKIIFSCHFQGKYKRPKAAQFNTIESYVKWSDDHANLRAQALDILKRFPCCISAQSVPPGDEEAAALGEWLEQYHEMTHHWYGTNRHGLMDEDEMVPQGVTKMMKSFAHSFRRSLECRLE